MDGKDKAATREQRLAHKLRENLHRRKAQARGQATDSAPPLPKQTPKS